MTFRLQLHDVDDLETAVHGTERIELRFGLVRNYGDWLSNPGYPSQDQNSHVVVTASQALSL